MQPLLDAVGSAVFQVGAVLLIARVAYAFSRRHPQGLLAWLGLHATTRRGLLAGAALVPLGMCLLAAGAAAPIPDYDEFSAGHSVHSLIRQAPSLPLLLLTLFVEACLQTSLSEEILFRGLLGKRLIARFGLALGNSVQAVLFASIHLLAPFQKLADPSWPLITFSFAVPALLGWLLGWINERLGGGSILPGWLAHAGLNFVGLLYVGFLLGSGPP